MSNPDPLGSLARHRRERDALRAELSSRHTATADAEGELAKARSQFGDNDRRIVRVCFFYQAFPAVKSIRQRLRKAL